MFFYYLIPILTKVVTDILAFFNPIIRLSLTSSIKKLSPPPKYHGNLLFENSTCQKIAAVSKFFLRDEILYSNEPFFIIISIVQLLRI